MIEFEIRLTLLFSYHPPVGTVYIRRAIFRQVVPNDEVV